MPVATPPPATAPSDPDWARWEAELAEHRAREPRDPGPPAPPDSPSGDDHGRWGDDDHGGGYRLLGLFLLLGGGLGLMAAVAFAASQGADHRRTITHPVPPVAASEPPETWRVQLGIPPSRQGTVPSAPETRERR